MKGRLSPGMTSSDGPREAEESKEEVSMSDNLNIDAEQWGKVHTM